MFLFFHPKDPDQTKVANYAGSFTRNHWRVKSLILRAVEISNWSYFWNPFPSQPPKTTLRPALPNLNGARIVQGGKTFSTPLFDNGLYCRWVWNRKKKDPRKIKNSSDPNPAYWLYIGDYTTYIYNIYIYNIYI